MLRTALKPRWLALLAVLIGVVVGFYQLGMWQLGVSTNEATRKLAEAQAARPTENLEDAFAPHERFGADQGGLSVRTTGHYRAEDQFLVPGRILDEQEGWWVVTPLVTEAPGYPALLPVMRGFVTDPTLADHPGNTELEITGTLAPPEMATNAHLPEGQRQAIDTAELANDWTEPLYNGFVFLTDEQPAVTGAEITPVPPPVYGETGVDWRNVGYGIQWFVFAGFAVYMYYRFLREDTERSRRRQREPDPQDQHEQREGETV